MHAKAILTVRNVREIIYYYKSLAFFQYSIKHSYYLKVFTKFLVEGVHVGDGRSLRLVVFLNSRMKLN